MTDQITTTDKLTIYDLYEASDKSSTDCIELMWIFILNPDIIESKKFDSLHKGYTYTTQYFINNIVIFNITIFIVTSFTEILLRILSIDTDNIRIFSIKIYSIILIITYIIMICSIIYATIRNHFINKVITTMTGENIKPTVDNLLKKRKEKEERLQENNTGIYIV